MNIFIYTDALLVYKSVFLLHESSARDKNQMRAGRREKNDYTGAMRNCWGAIKIFYILILEVVT